ncbi:hypothetical protein MIDIC_250018 [Alphaproteobacteria bacterium]
MTISRWVMKYVGVLEVKARAFKKSTAKSCRMDETYIKIKGK